MKLKIIYISGFIIAFLVTTGIIYLLNTNYNNIFQFDFSPAIETLSAKENKFTANLDSLKSEMMVELKEELLDSITSVAAALKDSGKVIVNDTIRIVTIDSTRILTPVETGLTVEENNTTEKIEPDSVYLKWTKTTARLYESMEPGRAAKIIVNYSDNVARDIIYSMKKKKAAEILSLLNPEVANRITRAKNGF